MKHLKAQVLCFGFVVGALVAFIGISPHLAWCSPQETIENLIRQLGSSDFKQRDAATQKLLILPQAKVALTHAQQSSDPEIAKRASWILEKRASRELDQRLERLRGLIKRGAVDSAAELVVPWPVGREENACWKALLDLCSIAGEFSKDQVCGPLDFGRLATRIFPRDVAVVAAPEIDAQNKRGPPLKGFPLFVRTGKVVEAKGLIASAIVVSNGTVELRAVTSSMIVACGDCTIPTPLQSLLVCDGDAKVSNARSCIIVARGDVTVAVADGCIIIAGGTVTCRSNAHHSRIVCGKDFVRREDGIVEDCEITERQKLPFGFVHFFDPVEEGIETATGKNGVTVKAVEAAKPFAKAGLLRGDVIAAVNGEKADTSESFRRLLRRAWVGDEDPTLQVIRNGKILDVSIAVPRK